MIGHGRRCNNPDCRDPTCTRDPARPYPHQPWEKPTITDLEPLGEREPWERPTIHDLDVRQTDNGNGDGVDGSPIPDCTRS